MAEPLLDEIRILRSDIEQYVDRVARENDDLRHDIDKLLRDITDLSDLAQKLDDRQWLSNVAKRWQDIRIGHLRKRHADLSERAASMLSSEVKNISDDINSLLREICELSGKVDSADDYQWLSDVAITWQDVFAEKFNVPKNIELSPPSGVVTGKRLSKEDSRSWAQTPIHVPKTVPVRPSWPYAWEPSGTLTRSAEDRWIHLHEQELKELEQMRRELAAERGKRENERADLAELITLLRQKEKANLLTSKVTEAKRRWWDSARRLFSR